MPTELESAESKLLRIYSIQEKDGYYIDIYTKEIISLATITKFKELHDKNGSTSTRSKK